jgi:hypothetical protein
MTCFLPLVSQMALSVVSWNLCGLEKLVRYPLTSDWLQGHDIILIQESLQTTQTYHFNDSTRIDFPATFTAGRAKGGLIVSLRNSSFGSSRVSVLINEEHMLAVDVTTANFHLIVVNVYVPVFSKGFTAGIYETVHSQIELLTLQHPTASIIVAGESIKNSLPFPLRTYSFNSSWCPFTFSTSALLFIQAISTDIFSIKTPLLGLIEHSAPSTTRCASRGSSASH